jgi:hypothetical protein
MEDHAGDDSRYMCMGRPISRVPKPRVFTGPAAWSLDGIIKRDEEEKRRLLRG